MYDIAVYSVSFLGQLETVNLDCSLSNRKHLFIALDYIASYTWFHVELVGTGLHFSFSTCGPFVAAWNFMELN